MNPVKRLLLFLALAGVTVAVLTAAALGATPDTNKFVSQLQAATFAGTNDFFLIDQWTGSNYYTRRINTRYLQWLGLTNAGFRSLQEFGPIGGSGTDASGALQLAFGQLATNNGRPVTLIVQSKNSNDPIRLDKVVTLEASHVRVEFRSPLLLGSNAGVRIMGNAAEMTRNGKAKAQLASDVAAGASILPLTGGTNQLHALDLAAGDVLVIRGQNDASGYALQHEIVHVASVNIGADTVTLQEALEFPYKTTYPSSDWVPDHTTGTTIGLLAYAPITNSITPGAYSVQCNPTNLAAAGITNGTLVRLYTVETEYDISATATNSDGEPYKNSARLELKNVASVSAAGVVTFDTPVVDTYSTNYFAGLQRLTPVTNSHLAGAQISYRQDQLVKSVHALQIGYGYGCSITDCAVDGRGGQRSQGLRLSDSMECQVLRSRVSYPKYLGSGEGYGIAVYYSERCQVLASLAEGCRHNFLVQKGNGTEIGFCRSVNDGISGIDVHGVRSFNTVIHDCQIVGGPLWAATHKSALRIGNTAHVCGDFGTLIEGCFISGLVRSNSAQTYAALDVFPSSYDVTWRGGQVLDADIGLRLSDDGQDDNLVRSNLVVDGVTFTRVRQLAQVDSATTNRQVLLANTTSVNNTNGWTFNRVDGLQVLYNRYLSASTNVTLNNCAGAVFVPVGSGAGGSGSGNVDSNAVDLLTWPNGGAAWQLLRDNYSLKFVDSSGGAYRLPHSISGDDLLPDVVARLNDVTNTVLAIGGGGGGTATNALTNQMANSRSLNMNKVQLLNTLWENKALIHIGTFGDSLGVKMTEHLPKEFVNRGWRFAGMRGTLGNSPYGNVNYGDAYSRGFNDLSTIPGVGAWPIWQVCISTNGGVIFKDNSAGNVQWPVNRVGVHYLTGPLRGTFDVLVGANGGPYTKIATVDASAADAGAGNTEWGVTLGYYTLIASNTAGSLTNIITGVDLYQSNLFQAFVLNNQSSSIHPTAQTISAIPTNVAAQYFAGQKVDFLWWENTDSTALVRDYLPTVYTNAMRYMCPTGIIVFSSFAPQIDLASTTADKLAEIGYVRDLAFNVGMPFFDKFAALGNTASNSIALGYLITGDTVHPTALANAVAFREFTRQSGWPPEPLVPTNSVGGYNFGQWTSWDTNAGGSTVSRIAAPIIPPNNGTNQSALWLGVTTPSPSNYVLLGYSVPGTEITTTLRGQAGIYFSTDHRPGYEAHGSGFLWPSGGWSFMDMWTDPARTIDPGNGNVLVGGSLSVGTNFTARSDGTISLGRTNSTEWFDAAWTETAATPGNRYGVRSTYTLDFGTNYGVSTDYAAVLGEQIVTGTNAYPGRARGVYGYFKHAGSGKATDGVGFWGVAQNASTGLVANLVVHSALLQNVSTGAVGTAIAYHVRTFENTNADGKVTNFYGLKVENQPNTTNDNFALYTGTNKNYFGGPTGIRTDPTGYQLAVQASAANTTPFIVKKSDGGTDFNVREDASKHAFVQMVNGSGATQITLHTSGDTFFRGGKVGLGTNTPQATLHVTGGVIFDGQGGMTNRSAFDLSTNDFISGAFYTNANQRALVSAVWLVGPSTDASVTGVKLWLDQDANGTWEQTAVGGLVSNGNGGEFYPQVTAWLQPGARFCFTNQLTGDGAVSLVVGSCQWVKQ